jgi:hypothetical protein
LHEIAILVGRLNARVESHRCAIQITLAVYTVRSVKLCRWTLAGLGIGYSLTDLEIETK